VEPDVYALSVAHVSDAAERFARGLSVAEAIRAAAVVTIMALLVASLLRRHVAEPFAIIGYVAAVVAACGVALECRRAIRERSATLP
jgi:hypothetical protein